MPLPMRDLGRRSEEMLLFAHLYAQQQGRAATLSDAARALSLPHKFNAMYYASRLEQAGLIQLETPLLTRSHSRPLRLTEAGVALAARMRADVGDPVLARVMMGLIDEQVRHYARQKSKYAKAVWYALRDLQAEARFLLDAPRPNDVATTQKGGEEDGEPGRDRRVGGDGAD